MVDTARQLLDELMGRNRNLDPNTAKIKKIQWDDQEFCLYYLVKFCPHDLFVNTRADLGQCPKLHDDEAKRLYSDARPSVRKRNYEDEFLRFSNHMINEVDRKIAKGKQRLQLMNKSNDGSPQVFVSKFQEQVNNLEARIKKLIGEAEEAGNRGDVDQAQGLMSLCDQLKDEKEALIKNHDSSENGTNGAAAWNEYTSSEKQMEVCEVCGAFLIVGDAQQRIEDHLTGKQHLGYSRLRNAIEEMYEQRRKDAEAEEKQREEQRRQRNDGSRRERRDERRDERRVDRRDDRDRRRDDFEDRRRGGGNAGGGGGGGGSGSGGFDRDRRRDDRRDGRRGDRRDDRGNYHNNRDREFRDNRNHANTSRRDDRDRERRQRKTSPSRSKSRSRSAQ